MAGVGSACLAVALLTALYAVGASIYGARSGRREWVTSGRRAIYCLAGLCVGAFAILESAFLRSDFSYALVAEGSSTDTPTFYKVTARVGDPGRLAAAVGDAAVAVRDRGAVPDAPLAARHRPVGDGGARRGRRRSSCS